MGGSIDVQSTVGRGSIFSVRLPLRLDTQTPAPERPKHWKDWRVLIVDEQKLSRRALAKQLSSLRIPSDVAATGEVALRMLRSSMEQGNPFQIVIADYRMTCHDGSRLVTALEADPSLKSMLVIALTPSGGIHPTDFVPGNQTVARLPKPVRPSQLLKTLCGLEPDPTRKSHGRIAAAQQSNQTRPRSAVRSGVSDTSLRALVVEDNVVNQRLAVRMLERLGVRADVAGNGREAVAALKMLPYDLVFMDCHMPEMDGFEATNCIRGKKDSPLHNTVIVALTADAMVGDREKCLQAGMNDYLNKPFKPEQVTEMLRKWMPKAA
jgi:CheY-like chemotaxis protein